MQVWEQQYAVPGPSAAAPSAPPTAGGLPPGQLSIPILGLLPTPTSSAAVVQPASGIPVGYPHPAGIAAPSPQGATVSAPQATPAPPATLSVPPTGVGAMSMTTPASAGYIVDPYYSSVYNSFAKPNAQIAGPSYRVPIPQENTAVDEDPVYVNAKQYTAILRRRQQRAKAEEQNKMLTARRPYLHKSRHNHAVRRPRGPGGRFLTAAELEEWRQKNNISETSNSESDDNGKGETPKGGARQH